MTKDMTTKRMYELMTSVHAPGIKEYYKQQILKRANINYPDSKLYADKIKQSKKAVK